MELVGVTKSIDNVFTYGRVSPKPIGFIWTEYYADVGTFEAKFKNDKDTVDFINTYKYVSLLGSTRVMKIRKIHLSSGTNEGSIYTVSGSSLEFILGYRHLYNNSSGSIYTDEFTIEGASQATSWNKLLEEAVEFPISRGHRAIRGVRYTNAPPYPLQHEEVPRPSERYAVEGGTTILDAIKGISKNSESAVGFRMYVYSTTGELHFNAYTPVDRTGSAGSDVLIFSKDTKELEDLEYLYTEEEQFNGVYATLNQLVSPLSEIRRYTRLSPKGSETADDFERFVKYQRVDYRSIIEDESNNITYSQAYKTNADSVSAELPPLEYVDGRVSENLSLTYDSDYYLGDIVYVESPLGGYVRSRIVSQTFTLDKTGYKTYPTLSDIGTA